MAEEIQIQTIDEVKNIDYMKATNEKINEQINEQINGIESLADTLDNVNSTLNLISDATINTNIPTDIIDTIDNIDTTVIEAQTQDILATMNAQQEQINNIESNINELNDKINQVLEKLE